MPTKIMTRLLAGTAVSALLTGAAFAADANARPYDIPQQDTATALQAFAMQSGKQVLFPYEAVKGKQAPQIKGDYSDAEVLALLAGSAGLRVTADDGKTVTLRPQAAAAGEGGDDAGTVQALIVTAQKREEDIQDVPIAISAFTQEDLTRSQVAGGPDLVTQVPNFTFTKTNFSGYSIQIRGIGTQAISATTDPAVAVAFNNTPFIRNRFFEQEFYDLERVEVLRGPQGTLYGRNATGGVVNIISAKPKFHYEAKLSGDVGNYRSSRLEGMVNIPLVEDKVALRVAGAWTKRDGYVTNEITGSQTDGRDLWSTRVSLRVQPTDRLNANLIWEHFQEDDDRLRSGKQLCKKDVVTEVAGFETPDYYMTLPNGGQTSLISGTQARYSQGCKRESLYANDSFQRPNGLMLPYYFPLGAVGLPTALTDPYVSVVNTSDGALISATNDQPENLRVIQSTIDPTYRAKTDLGELQISYDLTDALTLTSETAYSRDMVFSVQDFNRFNTAPGAWSTTKGGAPALVARGVLSADGYFCDPQLGCSNRLVAVDLSTAKATQFSQEFRLASNYQGHFNFSLGANFLRADSEDKYYVFFNSINLIAADSLYAQYNYNYVPGGVDNVECLLNGYMPGNPLGAYGVSQCTYMDSNPIGSLNDEGHNYFLSKNPYKLISYALFGEAYYKVTENLKITAGLRWTVDKKDAPRIPTWILVSQSVGYPVAEVIGQDWREPTGRLAIDWKPDLSFTDETLLYASFAHGYKAGGANPPGFARIHYGDPTTALANAQQSSTRPRTFEPEFVDAYELGAKNTLDGGRVTLNLAGFYYDYTGYQVSEIVDRSAFNRNFDATVWGVELESAWRPLENLKLGFKAGYEKTRIADGEQAIDLMDRTAGDPRWVVARPFPTYASSCILPAWVVVGGSSSGGVQLVDLGSAAGGGPSGCELAYQQGVDPGIGAAFHSGTINYTLWSTDPNDYPGYTWPNGVVTNRTYPGWNPATAPNNGEGISKPLGGNELPNAPHYTATVTGDYTVPLPSDWLMTLHSDVHWQSQSWWRVFNDNAYDKLHPYFTMNLAAIFTNEEAGWNIMAYVKNVTNETAITGAFLNSDDTGLTTNVFLTEPRLYGLRVTKQWTGDAPWGDLGIGGEGPHPFTIELGGQVQRHDAPNDVLAPSFVDEFAAPLDLNGPAQGDKLDWGDGREVKLTYRPDGSPWNVSAGVRFGKTNGQAKRHATEHVTGGCIFGGKYAPACAYYMAKDPEHYAPLLYPSIDDHVDARAFDHEEHTVADFMVGRDVGFGGPGRSQVSAGLRFARLKSLTNAELRGVPNWEIPEGSYLPGADITHTTYHSEIDARREFMGAGPELKWDAALPLLNLSVGGKVEVEWSLAGGALFGNRKTVSSGTEKELDYISPFRTLLSTTTFGGNGSQVPIATRTATVDVAPRSSSDTVPFGQADLGLAYRAGGFKVGAGYRWERYFDAIDGGFRTEEKEDRTIDGPYFEVSVGFGG